MSDSQVPVQEVWHELQLPSRLLPYSGVSKVEARVMRGGDEKFLAEMTQENYDKNTHELFKRTLRGIDPGELTLGDRLFIMLWNTINSYTKIFPVDTMCDQCLRPLVDLPVELDKLDDVLLPADYKEPHEVKLPVCGQQINLRLYRLKDELQFAAYEKSLKSGKPDSQPEPWLYRLALSIVDDKDIFQRIAFVKELTTIDTSMIRAFHEKFLHGIKMEWTFKCPLCGEEAHTVVPFRIQMFVPDGATVAASVGAKL